MLWSGINNSHGPILKPMQLGKLCALPFHGSVLQPAEACGVLKEREPLSGKREESTDCLGKLPLSVQLSFLNYKIVVVMIPSLPG